ncbi:uncharacterized protein LOC143293508 [Babylonia areolata]|uniref:uncharacterized protein LOC143293508 n=1 Tax=Babylonia areolata TaxID=304850 RepID=UPI003FD3C88F
MEGKLEQQQPGVVDESYPEPHPHLTTLTAPPPTSMLDMTSYSQSATSSAFPLDLHPQQPPHYYPDLADWQHAGVTADPGVQTFYTFSDRPDLAPVPLYHTSFPSSAGGVGVAPHSDLYASSPTLWHHPHHHPHHPAAPALVEDPSNVLTSSSAQRYLPPLTRASGSSSSSSSSSSPSGGSAPSTGKPKRRRVQSVTQRKAANVRERRRMFHLNTAFDELRKRLPAFNYEKRLSRIETLRLAMTYIGFMKDVMTGQDPRKVKLRGTGSDAGSDLSHIDMESCTSEDPHHEDVES